MTFTERDYKTLENSVQDSINEAEKACAEKVKIAWNGTSYTTAGDFDFADVFSQENQELNIYPSFVAVVRTLTAKFTDGQGTVVSTQKIRYGEKATPPQEIPMKLELDENNVSLTYAYPF